MAQYVIVYDNDLVQHVEADSAEHDISEGVFRFRNSDGDVIAWVREFNVNAVALASILKT
ncbi:hypothetical protein HW130_03050 [Streptomyces sp. PKU-EA00015]|uniref:hypothetical protein n=1 Tax=Streptomyces sp. PKU-EA00015 TaxID=2748326 RepID=UPI00159FFBC4|nr:hypothetical protein [Streptomyces sp. PKU-EA00015]NWF25249.1 hypothetical protein [Streptomyces sp. PKU-EA00015]